VEGGEGAAQGAVPVLSDAWLWLQLVTAVCCCCCCLSCWCCCCLDCCWCCCCCQVLFLNSSARLPYIPGQVAAAAAALDPKSIPGAMVARQRHNHRQLPASFLCNMFLVRVSRLVWDDPCGAVVVVVDRPVPLLQLYQM